MNTSLAYVLGGSNSFVWSWFFWVYLHPLASIIWFVFCFFALMLSIELQQKQKRAVAIETSYKRIENSTEVVDVIVIPPLQLNPVSVHTQTKNTYVAIAQLPNSLD